MGAASRIAILVCLITGAVERTGWCANFVYKGTQVARSVATGEKVSQPAYLVLAENGIVDVSDDYVYTQVRMVFVGGIVGRKHFARIELPDFRTLHLTSLVGGKLRGATIVSRGNATASNIGSHSIQAEVFTGIKKDPTERMPPKLQGVSISAAGAGASAVATGGIQLSTSKYSLVRDLTDQAQPAETVEQTIDRIVAFLESKGLTEFTP